MGCVSSKHFKKQADAYSAVPAFHDWEQGRTPGVLDIEKSYHEDPFFKSYGVLDMDKSSYQDTLFGLAHRQNHSQEWHIYDAEEGGTLDFAFASVHEMKQILLANKDGVKDDFLRNGLFVQQHYDDVEHENMEIINTWELMEGLEDLSRTSSPLRGYSGRKQERTPSPLRGYNGSKLSIPVRTISVNEHGVPSSDMESPVWKKYYIPEGVSNENPSFGGISTSPFSDSPRRPVSGEDLDDYANLSSMEPFDGESTAGLKFLLNSTNSSPCYPSPLQKTAWASSSNFYPSPIDKQSSYQSAMAMFDADAASPYGSQTVSPYRSPNLRILSRQHSYGSTSPMFDPTLMATFEQALHATINADYKQQLLQSSTDDGLAHDSSNLETACKQGDSYCASRIMPMDEEHSCFKTSLASYPRECPPRGDAKVVLYFTSLRGIRKTYEECCYLRLILGCLRVQVDERDVWMHSKFKEELADLIGNELNGSASLVPQLFIDGRYIGGADVVKQLHEEGILAKLLHGLATNVIQNMCCGCGDARFVPCLVCNGSCKVIQQYGVSRCWECNENGLIMCPICVR